jgi:hypothetical protein
MKTKVYGLIAISLALSGCVMPLTVAQPTATAIPPTETQLPTETGIPTDTPEPSQTLTPSETAEPSETPTRTPTATEPPFDPAASYGSPTIFDSMDNNNNWVQSNGQLPDTDFIRLALGGGRLHVTGKQPNFDTWWFSWPSPSDFFIQMTVDVDNCSGKQAYGMIVRGPQEISVTSARGYILTFSCDGSYRLVRLDDTSPYTTEELIPWTESDHIDSGSNKTNTMGIRMQGADLTIYANGFEVHDLDDDEFSAGRFGVFVNAGAPGNFTFSIDELAYWNLN